MQLAGQQQGQNLAGVCTMSQHSGWNQCRTADMVLLQLLSADARSGLMPTAAGSCCCGQHSPACSGWEVCQVGTASVQTRSWAAVCCSACLTGSVQVDIADSQPACLPAWLRRWSPSHLPRLTYDDRCQGCTARTLRMIVLQTVTGRTRDCEHTVSEACTLLDRAKHGQ